MIELGLFDKSDLWEGVGSVPQFIIVLIKPGDLWEILGSVPQFVIVLIEPSSMGL